MFSEAYTSYIRERLKKGEEDFIKSLLKSEDFLREYIVERIKLFFQGSLLKLTEMDLELIRICESYYDWRKKYLKGRQIVLGEKIIFRQDPDRGWSERGTG
ncbi:MAG: hypothetical protein QW228_05020, partial [Candidatus Aenigmatarchaeota archaeon]